MFIQAVRKVNDGICMTAIASGAFEQLTQITIRQQELAEQAANGTYSNALRRALYGEANAWVKEYNRLIETPSFKGVSLLLRS